MNFLNILKSNGFKQYLNNSNLSDNWFGCSLYHPEVLLVSNNKKVLLSLQGIRTPIPKNMSNELHSLFKNMSVKYIEFKNSEKILYQNWTGELPNKEFINKFIYEK